MKLKKVLKIISINILILYLLFILGEVLCCSVLYTMEYKHNIETKRYTVPYSISKHIKEIKKCIEIATIPNEPYFSFDEFRNPSGLEYKSSTPIVVLGCSFTYGDKLKDNETFSHVLSNHTKRPVYNLGLSGGSPKEILYILENQKLRNKFLHNNNKIEYVIYTYIQSHRYQRLNINIRPRVPHYKKKGNELEYYNAPYESYLRRLIYNSLIKYFKPFKQSSEKLFILYMTEIQKEINKTLSAEGKEPTKFVILVYEDDNIVDWEILENQGIIVIKLKELIKKDIYCNEEYTIKEDKFHPNAKAWEIIVPALVKELNL